MMRARVLCDFGDMDSVGMEMIDEHAVYNSCSQIFNSGFIDLIYAIVTLRVRLIQLIIWDLLQG